ncbi:MAG: hypothetical protein KDK26_00800 [Roseivivax sp.]|nr:hypothetical protein [Roseivivax sp.]
MRDTNNELDSLRTGPASWSSLKIFGLLWAVVFSALLLNAVLMSGAAQLWGHDNFPSGMLFLGSVPASLVGAWLLLRWVRRLIDEADHY